MKKKGMVIRPMIFWILGIFVVLLIIYLFVGPGQLLSKARDAIFFSGPGVSP